MPGSASIGRQLGLEDYAKTGWTAAELGLDKLDLAGIRSLLETGKA